MSVYDKFYLTQERQFKLFDDALIVFDTSALLDLYYYSEKTQDSIFNTVFEYFKERLWIPERVKFEYIKNKDKVSNKPVLAYEGLLKSRSGSDGEYTLKMCNYAKDIKSGKFKDIENQLKTLKERTSKSDKHPYISEEEYTDIEKQIAYFSQNLETFISVMENFNKKFSEIVIGKIREIEAIEGDKVAETIERMFRVGDEISYEEMLKIVKEGELRYRNEIPPGYEDEDEKKGLAKYGDLIIWKEILLYAKKEHKSVIFVCNDVKKDWYDQEGKKVARFELLKEFNSITGKNVWLYSMPDFLFIVNKLLDNTEKLNETVLAEVKNVSVVVKEEETHFYKIKKMLYNLIGEKVESIETFIVPEEIEIIGPIHSYLVTLTNGLNMIYLVNFIDQNVHYTRILNPLRNIHRIKEYYGVKYGFAELFVALSPNNIEQARKFFERERVEKLFNSEEIEVQVGYVEDDNFVSVMHNNPVI